AVDGLFSYTGGTDEGFNAALFDVSGLYTGHSGQWTHVSAHVPSSFYSTQISARVGWIDGIVPPASPSDSSDAPLFGPGASFAFAGLLLVCGAAFPGGRARPAAPHAPPSA